MKNWFLLGCIAAALVFSACKGKPKEVSRAARAEAAQNVSEADFATQIRDYPRAEAALEKAVSLDPEVASYWKALGVARKQRGNSSGARVAYEKARDLSHADYRRSEKKNLEAVLNEMEISVLLGQAEEARKILAKAAADHPADDRLKQLIAAKVVDRMLADAAVKAVSL
jgi:Flp pilus assembly protein TadD